MHRDGLNAGALFTGFNMHSGPTWAAHRKEAQGCVLMGFMYSLQHRSGCGTSWGMHPISGANTRPGSSVTGNIQAIGVRRHHRQARGLDRGAYYSCTQGLATRPLH